MTDLPDDNECIEDSIAKVIEWFESKGYVVYFKQNVLSQLHPNGVEGEVVVNSSRPRKIQLYLLLHEAGHYVVARRKNYVESFGKGYPATVEDYEYPLILQSDAHRIHILGEEYAAWDAARALAKRLDVIIDAEQWDNLRTKLLMTYVTWSAATMKNSKKKIDAYSKSSKKSKEAKKMVPCVKDEREDIPLIVVELPTEKA